VSVRSLAKCERNKIRYTTLKTFCDQTHSNNMFVAQHLSTFQIFLKVLNMAAPAYATGVQESAPAYPRTRDRNCSLSEKRMARKPVFCLQHRKHSPSDCLAHVRLLGVNSVIPRRLVYDDTRVTGT
jgi:hypothetical protein